MFPPRSIQLVGSEGKLPTVALLFVLGCGAVSSLAQTPHPAGFDSLSQRASAAWNANRLDEAARLYRQALKVRPAWPEGWGYLASSLYQLKRYDEARQAYRQTTVLTPKNGPSWAWMALCEYELRDYQHAFSHFAQARKLGLGGDQPLVLNVAYRMAILWNTAGEFERGAMELKIFNQLNQKNSAVVEALGLSVLRMPKFPYEIPPAKHDLVMQAGEAGWEQNGQQLADAQKLYRQLVAAYPSEPNVHYAYGYLLGEMWELDQSLSEFERELQITPRNVPAIVQAAVLALRLGQVEKSEKLARGAIVLDPRNYAPHNLLGRILTQRGDNAKGIQELEIATRLAPNNAQAHFNLAQAYQKTGKKEDAKREFAVFMKLNKDAGQDAAQASSPLRPD